MKKYTTPELKELSFIPQEAINSEDGALEGSQIFNDNTFKKWD